MKLVLKRPTNREGLFIWIIHRFSEEFGERAILKGGLVLRLLNSPRLTNDVDFLLAPYSKKREVRSTIEAILEDLVDAEVDVSLHSTMLRANIRIDGIGAQIECSVARECRSIPLTTGAMAETHGYPPQVIRIMDLSVALAHKLAAWNERRLVRDLYDAYYLVVRVGERPDIPTLTERLSSFRSRRPKFRKIRSMTIPDFKDALTATLAELTDQVVDEELGGLLPAPERAGLSLKIRVALSGILESLS